MLHQKLNSQANALGYHLGDRGICFGLTSMALQAMLANDFKRFVKRLELLSKIPMDDFVHSIESINKHHIDKIKQIKELKLPSEEEEKHIAPTETERFLLEIQPFFDGLALHFNPWNYTEVDVDNKFYRQNFSQTFSLTKPRILESQDVIKRSQAGVYNENELIKYLESIEECVKSKPEINFNIPILLNDYNHTILITYESNTQQWIFFDPNYLPKIERANNQRLAKLILLAFNSDLITISSDIYATDSNALVFNEKMDQLSKHKPWIDLHKISQEKISYKRSDGMTWLTAAIGNNSTEQAKALIQSGADVNARQYNETPIHIAVANQNIELVTALLEEKANPDPGFGTRPIETAIQTANSDIVMRLINAGVEVNSGDQDGRTPLLIAILFGKFEIAELLIKLGANLNQPDNTGFTPLHYAIYRRNRPLVELLLKHGANIHLQNNLSTTPMHEAILSKNLPIIKALLHAKTEEKYSPPNEPPYYFDFVVANGDIKIIELFLEAGEDLNKRNKYELNPLTIAVNHENKAVVELLIKKGADVDSKTDYIPCPLIHAAVQNNSELVNILLNAKANPNNMNSNDNTTALQIASCSGNLEIIRLLLQAGADANTPNLRGETPLSMAILMGHFNVIELLIENTKNLNTNIEIETNTLLIYLQSTLNQMEYLKVLDLLKGSNSTLPERMHLNALHLTLLYKKDDLFNNLINKISPSDFESQIIPLNQLAHTLGNESAAKLIDHQLNSASQLSSAAHRFYRQPQPTTQKSSDKTASPNSPKK